MASAAKRIDPRSRSAAPELTEGAPDRPARRIDPRSRSTDAAMEMGIVNGRRDRRYALVNKRDETGGIEHYQSIGWHILDPTTDPERIRGGRQAPDGASQLEARGAVLMYIGLEDWHDLMKRGPFGNSGQDMADRIQKASLNAENAAKDAFRGRGEGLQLKGSTTSAADNDGE